MQTEKVELYREEVNVYYGNYGTVPEKEIMIHYNDGSYEFVEPTVECDEDDAEYEDGYKESDDEDEEFLY
ncbi:hypothetical protein [Priestia taiwanensis]|uniref:Uncharacterized protein n=1 Tax=Priestia taiwanensis TaxID=1347902 RepID=A0A917ESD9_9BACI|nr:hypothetical protein [Priestia taiwanensis]MBM7364587.1 hypothetical protein [Priestia taiwanensis]GGE80303.1 hypothetical protein GCM10007140_32320 [Priestia taiwanensis]